MVKSLHPIEKIAARILECDGGAVRLTNEAGGASSTVEDGNSCPADVVAAVARALAEPLEYPPLAAGIVPGDRVAVAVDSDVPCVASVVRGAVEALQAAGVELCDIAIVTTDAGTCQLCRDELGQTDGGLQFAVHDPTDDNNLCLVGTTKRGEPLLVNRTIYDADVVLPIGCARLGIDSAYDSLFPRFSNDKALDEYRTPAQHDALVNRYRKRNEADEAGWLIGVPMTVQVIPGSGATVESVLAGEPQAVARRCEALCRQRWLLSSPQRVSLLVATVTGGAATQTWANVGGALATAEHVLAEGGAVAICSNLEEPPGESLGRLVGSLDLDATLRRIWHDHGADAWPAWHLARALQRGPVYFLSQLNSETVEDLGLAPVDSVDDLVRLAGRHDSFMVVDDSQHAVVKVDGETDGR